MEIKYKNKQPLPLGYELDKLISRSMSGPEGPFTHIELEFKTLNVEHTIPFDIRGNSLFTKIDIRAFARKLKNKDIAECIEESLKFVKMKGTIMNNAYISIAENTPVEVIDSNEAMIKIYSAIPKRYHYMADICFQKRKETEEKFRQNHSATED